MNSSSRNGLFIIVILVLFSVAGWWQLQPSAASVQLDNARIRLLPGNGPQGGFFALHNHTDNDISLTAASSPAFGRIMLHRSSVIDGVANMRHVTGGVSVQAGETIEFTPGGLHLMMMQATAPLQPDQSIPVTLHWRLADQSADHSLSKQTFTFTTVSPADF